MPTTAVPALRHAQSAAPYNANTFAEQNAALIGRSARLSGFDVVSFVSGVSLTLAPGAFISRGLVLNPAFPTRVAGIVAQTTANAVLDATGFTTDDDFYVFALANSVSEATTVDLVIAAAPAAPGQNAPILRYVAGQFVMEDGSGGVGLEEQVARSRTEGGADQFLLTPTLGTNPPEVSIEPATLPDGTGYAGDVGFTGNPAFTVPGTNYIYFRISTGQIENSNMGFPNDNDSVNLWVLALDALGNITSLTDRRPWFGGGTGSGGSGVALAGKTYVPVTNDAGQEVLSVTSDPAPGAFITDSIDLSLAAFTVPPGATHALVRVLADIDIAAGVTLGGCDVYASWSGDPRLASAVAAAANPNLQVVNLNGNAVSENNITECATRIVELLVDPFGPGPHIDIVSSLTGTLDPTAFIRRAWIEGFFIDDQGSAPLPINPRTGLTAVVIAVGAPLGPLTAIPVPLNTGFIDIEVFIRESITFHYSVGTFTIDVAQGRIDGGYTSASGNGATVGADPSVSGSAVLGRVLAAVPPFLDVQTDSFTGPGGLLVLKTAVTASGSAAILVVARFFRAAISEVIGTPPETVPFTCTAAEAVDDWVYVSAPGAALRALANAPATKDAVGYIVDKPSPTSCLVALYGRAPGTGLTPAAPVFLSDVTPGLATSTVPVASGSWIVPLGMADTASSFLIQRGPVEEIP